MNSFTRAGRLQFGRFRSSINRVFGILVVFYVLVAAPPNVFAPWVNVSAELLGLVMLCVAAFGRLWSLTFAAGNKDRLLVTEGPYSIVRNPLYIFGAIGAIGFGLAAENPWLVAVLIVFCAAYYPITVKREEKHLLKVFGPEYRRYRYRVPRWVPNFGQYHEPETLVVHPARIRAGIVYAMGYMWAFLLWDALEEFRETGILHTWF